MFDIVTKHALRNRSHTRLSAAEVKRMQRRKFRELVAHVAERSPYYQDVIKQCDIDIKNCVPEDFPMLTKDILMENFDRIVTDRRITKDALTDFLAGSQDPLERFLDTYFVVHSSGSSGKLGYVAYTEEELVRGLIHFSRVKRPTCWDRFVFIGATKAHYAGVTMSSVATHMPLFYEQVETLDINMPFSELLAALQKMQPTWIRGYAFALRKIAEAQKEGKLQIQPEVLQSGGEPLSPGDKVFVEETFKAPVVDVYACSEHFIMGIDKDEYGGMYLMEDDLIFELYPTFTCITNLFNYTTPLIRYKMTDSLEEIQDTTNVLPFRKVANLVGKTERVPIFINDDGEEDFISPLTLAFYVPHVVSFQFRLLSNRAFVFSACLGKGLTKKQIEQAKKDSTQKLRSILQEKKMSKVSFTVELVDHLWAEPDTGKFRLIVKEY